MLVLIYMIISGKYHVHHVPIIYGPIRVQALSYRKPNDSNGSAIRNTYFKLNEINADVTHEVRRKVKIMVTAALEYL